MFNLVGGKIGRKMFKITPKPLIFFIFPPNLLKIANFSSACGITRQDNTPDRAQDYLRQPVQAPLPENIRRRLLGVQGENPVQVRTKYEE